jgi:hypothetical protein
MSGIVPENVIKEIPVGLNQLWTRESKGGKI